MRGAWLTIPILAATDGGPVSIAAGNAVLPS
jgi:hypothetical protein